MQLLRVVKGEGFVQPENPGPVLGTHRILAAPVLQPRSDSGRYGKISAAHRRHKTLVVCIYSLRVRPIVCGRTEQLATERMIETSDRLRFRQDWGVVLVPCQNSLLDVVNVHPTDTRATTIELVYGVDKMLR